MHRGKEYPFHLRQDMMVELSWPGWLPLRWIHGFDSAHPTGDAGNARQGKVSQAGTIDPVTANPKWHWSFAADGGQNFTIDLEYQIVNFAGRSRMIWKYFAAAVAAGGTIIFEGPGWYTLGISNRIGYDSAQSAVTFISQTVTPPFLFNTINPAARTRPLVLSQTY